MKRLIEKVDNEWGPFRYSTMKQIYWDQEKREKDGECGNDLKAIYQRKIPNSTREEIY